MKKLSDAAKAAINAGPLTTVIGHCTFPGCKYHVRLEVPPITILDDDDVYGLTYPKEGVPEGKRWVGTLAWLDDRAPYSNRARCPEHTLYAVLTFGVLRATTTSKQCDDSCRHATGSECKCSCGGSNHGIM